MYLCTGINCKIMKAIELIKKLEEKIKEFGDLDVYSVCNDDYYMQCVCSVVIDEHFKTRNKYFILEGD